MKKINLFELLSIGLIILIGCFLISIAAKKLLDIDSDFLSASATFFAGVVAYKLFNDWRTQYRTELLERLKDRFSALLINMEKEIDLLDYLVTKKEDDFQDINVFTEIYDRVDIVSTLIENFVDELDFYEQLYNEFGLDRYSEVTPPTDMLVGFDEIYDRLNVTHINTDDNEEFLKELLKYLDSRDASTKIIKYKLDLSRDLHLIIIDMIKDKKGH